MGEEGQNRKGKRSCKDGRLRGGEGSAASMGGASHPVAASPGAPRP